MRDSLKKMLENPALSDAFKIKALTEELLMMEDLLETVRDSRREAFRRLAVAGAVMDAQTTKRYIAELAQFN